MDPERFDSIATLIGGRSRRRIIGLLAALPFMGIHGGVVVARPKREAHRATVQRRRKKRAGNRGNACIPTGTPCDKKKKKRRGHGKRRKVKKLSCNRCCQGHVTTVNSQKVCACQQDALPCTTSEECCTGVCSNGVCGASPICPPCSGRTPICQGSTCVACTRSDQCPPNTHCDSSGSCLPCDVCATAGACAFSSVQAAINGTPIGGTLRVCAGTYVEDIELSHDLTVIGAGDGADPATDTILQGTGLKAVVESSAQDLTLRKVRITGGDRTGDGGGVLHAGRLLTMTDCTVTGNESSGNGGGVSLNNVNSVLVMNRCAITNNRARGSFGGGISVLSNPVTLIDSVVAGNSSRNEGGGIFVLDGTITLSNTRVGGNAPAQRNRAFGDNSPGGGIKSPFGIVRLTNGSFVCGNLPDQCAGFSNPASCLATCPT